MVVSTHQQLQLKLQAFKPRKKWYRRFVRRSAVALIIREGESGLEVLMIKRAEREGDPWSGHMAFPGGRAEEDDQHHLHTAQRETWEEIGLDTERFTRLQTRLSDLLSPPRRDRRAMLITPYVFTIDDVPDLDINYEVDEVVWVPLSFLADPDNRQSIISPEEKRLNGLPCYYFEDRQIWGLSLRMLDELIELIRV